MKSFVARSMLCAALGASGYAGQARLAERGPILFEPVGGAAPGGARFAARANGYRVYFESGRAVFDFGSEVASMTLAGAKPTAMTGEGRIAAIHNSYRGDQKANWREGVPSFERIRYSRVLPGIDLTFYGRAGSGLEFDLTLAAGADPGAIELRYDGFRSIQTSAEGGLILETNHGMLRQALPEVTQGGRRIGARYVKRGSAVGIELDSYDTLQPLLIDPRISYATYLGGSSLENTQAIAIGGDGSYYVAANTFSPNYPALPAGQTFPGDADIVVSKFSAANTLIYSTVIGGTLSDVPGRAVIDSDGSLLVSFTTASANFPRPPGSTLGGATAGDGILRLSPTGTLAAVAVLGPTAGVGPYDLTLDASRSVWITGGTRGVPGQTGAIQASVAGGVDMLVARLNGTLTQITYLAYLGTPADENGNRIQVDAAGNVYVTGVGGSAAFPTGGGKAFPGSGAFAVKLDPVNNRILFAAYLTGSNGGGYGLVLDGDNVWVGANSNGTNFTPTPDAIQTAFGGGASDAVLMRLSAADGKIGYATYFGGSGAEFVNDLALDAYGNLLLFGNTTSANLQTTADALRKTFTAPATVAAFVAAVDGGGRLVYASYVGGSGPVDLGLGIAVDPLGNAIAVGATSSPDFPVTPDGFQRALAGGQDVFIERIEFVGAADPSLARVAIQNAASFRGGAVAPGEVITIYPRNVGPAQLTTAALTPERRIATLIGGTRVLFDDIPAPLVYTASGQVSLVVPYEVQGKAFTRVVVEYNGVKSRATVVPVTATAPGVFTAGNGSGPAVVVNQDGSFNSAGAPADRGSVVVFFATGEGQTSPEGVDGRLNEFARLEDFPKPLAPVSVSIGGQPAEILFAAGAPGFLAGLMQFNVRVPAGVQPGAAVPLSVNIGGVASAAGVTMAVR